MEHECNYWKTKWKKARNEINREANIKKTNKEFKNINKEIAKLEQEKEWLKKGNVFEKHKKENYFTNIEKMWKEKEKKAAKKEKNI